MTPESRATRKKFTLTRNDKPMDDLVKETDQKTLAVWAVDCAERVMPFYEEIYPDDPRPRNAIKTLRAWIDTGVFRMADIRRASLASHAAAREAGEDTAARSAARAAGQAVATAHVKTHSSGAALYAQQAIWRATSMDDADAAVARERDWQERHLLRLRKNNDDQ
jgi:hypothetical protein